MSTMQTNTPLEGVGYSPIRVYDQPMLIASQFLENEATFAGIRNTFFKQGALSPKERTTFVDDIKARLGSNPLLNAAIDIGTNPWAWFFFVTSPAAMPALKAGTSIFKVASRFSPYVTENYPFLAKLRSPLQLLDGTPVGEALMQFSNRKLSLDEGVSQALAGAEARVMNKLGVKNLDPRQIANEGKRAQVERMWYALEGSMAGLDQPHVVRRVASWSDKSKGIKWKTEAQEMVTKEAGAFDRVLQEADALELRNVIRAEMDKVKKDLFLTSSGAVDVEKTLKLALGVGGLRKILHPDQGHQGKELLARIMGFDVAEMLSKGASKEFLEKNIVELVEGTINQPYYFPRNYAKPAGVDVTKTMLWESHRSRTIAATGSIIPRASAKAIYHPDELDRFRQLLDDVVDHDVIGNRIKTLRETEAKLKREGKVVFWNRMGAWESTRRYFSDANQTRSWYLTAPDDAVLRADRETLKYINNDDRIAALGESKFRPSPTGKRAAFDQALLDVPADHVPVGGWSLADVVERSYHAMRNLHVQRNMREIIIPRAIGHMPLENAGLTAALNHSKQWAESFLLSPAGLAIRDQGGKYGRQFWEKMKLLSNPEFGIGANETAGGLAKVLYSSHLGLNVGSVVLNMSQPFLLAGTWVGVKPLLKAYGSAFKELGGYLESRWKQGFRQISEAERNALIQKHFKHASQSGDLMGIRQPLVSTIDNLAFDPSQVGRMSRSSTVVDYTLKLFEKAEWMNRSVTAHAVENAYRAAGRSAGPRMYDDIRRMVLETQFGGDMLNTPLAFQKGFFSNPLMRQFLSFPLRSATGVLLVGPKLSGAGETTKSLLWSGAKQFGRGMGLSAIVYELGKNVLGADLSRGLFWSATTDIAGGERFLEDGNEWIQVPPIIDIPIDFIRGVAGDDERLVSQSIFRSFPGGVAIGRAMGYAPDMSEVPGLDLVDFMQQRHVGWDQMTSEGYVPVFKGDGTLIDMRHAGSVILKALGADLGQFNSVGDLDNFMVKNRDEMIMMKRDIMTALLANDTSKALSLAADFERRFGTKPSITKAQLENLAKSRQITRPERILDRIPQEARPMYQKIVAQQREQLKRMGLRPEDVQRAATASLRDRFTTQSQQLDPETVRLIQQITQQSEARLDQMQR